MGEAFIVEAVRTPVGRGREDGALAGIHPVELLAGVLNEVTTRAGVDKGDIDDIIAGCVSPTNDQGANIPRLALLKAGFPVHVPAVQIDRMCGSSQQAVHFASQAILAGDADLVIASGIEMMSRCPMGSSWGVLTDEFLETFPFALAPMGVCAERIAEKWNIQREECDQYSLDSHLKAARATENGYFQSQIMPVDVSQNGTPSVVNRDEGIRPNSSLEKLASLRTVFKEEGGVVTAASASQISDGAAAILLASEKKSDALGLKKRARIVARVAVGSEPEYTLTGPIPATRKVLEKAGLTMDDMDVIEINEAFATVILAWQKELQPDMNKVNPNGGAIAMGHPLGATGAVLMTKLMNELERTGGRYGLQTMCIGHGQATATIIERVEG